MIEEKPKNAQALAEIGEIKAAESSKPTMRVKVYSPFKIYYEEESYSISAVNATGPFDIFPHHHNFMTLLEPSVVTIRPAGVGAQEQKIRISGGLMHVKGDKVIIFLDI